MKFCRLSPRRRSGGQSDRFIRVRGRASRHNCRRVFASEHLNNNVPVHVIQALLGHATLDTVMVYAKLYPTTLIEEYRKAVRGLYNAFTAKAVSATPPPRNGRRLQSAARCGTWARISARCRPVSTVLKGSSASAARTRSRNRVLCRSFVACSPAMSVRSGRLATAANPLVRSPRGRLKSHVSARHDEGLKNSRPTSPPQSKGKLDEPVSGVAPLVSIIGRGCTAT